MKKIKKIDPSRLLLSGGIILAGIFLLGAVFAKVFSGSRVYSGTALIEMTADGFSPSEIIVTKGTSVKFMNKDAPWHWPAADPHPSHAFYPEFDPKLAIAPGRSWIFVFNKVGEWGMHDHLAPYTKGKIIVIE